MNKSKLYKRELLHKRIEPVAIVDVKYDKEYFQDYKIVKLSDIEFPIKLEKECIIIDFGDHYTGYLHIEMSGTDIRIPDSPTNIEFYFAEMPIELVELPEDSPTSLSIGWMQKDFKTIAFMPNKTSLERRYSFRYLKLTRVDSVRFPIMIDSLYLDAVSAVDIDNVKKVEFADKELKRIDDICVKTLKECEQDVFEDGPKRDRRLWIGDLRLQALVDYETFKNIDLIKRCIYLFAEHRNNKGLIVPCVFPDTPPYVDQWFYLDYSLWFVSCVYEYLINTGDKEFANELYDIALEQVKFADSVFNREKGVIEAPFFIDHGKFDKTVSALSLFAYVIKQLISLSETLGKSAEYLEKLIKETYIAVLKYYSQEEKLFISPGGEISWHSQIWGTLSGALPLKECAKILNKTAEINPLIRCSSPYMNHYYLEALYNCGMKKEAVDFIKYYWGAIIDAGFDCCPECFEIGNERLTPYSNTSLNSACHAWSCTPSYWLRKYL